MKNSLFYNDIEAAEEQCIVKVIRNSLLSIPVSEISEVCELTVFQLGDLIIYDLMINTTLHPPF